MSNRSRHALIGAGVASLVILLWLTSAIGGTQDNEISQQEIESYPDGPITLVSWATPGGPSDILARMLASVGPRYFGQRITVLTRQGGSGAVGMGYLARQRPDGYTLGINTSSGTISMAAGHIPFAPDDFTGILGIQVDPFVVGVRADSPFENIGDLFAFADQNPGRLSVSGFGTASAPFLAFESLKSAAGDPTIRWIAYEGSGDANVAVLGGHTDAVSTNYSVVREHVRAGTMRVLGSSTRITDVPGVATFAEQGLEVAPMHWRGVAAPPGMPAELAWKIRDLLLQTISDPEFRQFMENTGNEYSEMDTPEEFQEWLRSELIDSRRLMEALNLIGQIPQ